MSGFINKNSGKKMLLPLLLSLVMVAVQAMMQQPIQLQPQQPIPMPSRSNGTQRPQNFTPNLDVNDPFFPPGIFNGISPNAAGSYLNTVPDPIIGGVHIWELSINGDKYHQLPNGDIYMQDVNRNNWKIVNGQMVAHIGDLPPTHGHFQTAQPPPQYQQQQQPMQAMQPAPGQTFMHQQQQPMNMMGGGGGGGTQFLSNSVLLALQTGKVVQKQDGNAFEKMRDAQGQTIYLNATPSDRLNVLLKGGQILQQSANGNNLNPIGETQKRRRYGGGGGYGGGAGGSVMQRQMPMPGGPQQPAGYPPPGFPPANLPYPAPYAAPPPAAPVTCFPPGFPCAAPLQGQSPGSNAYRTLKAANGKEYHVTRVRQGRVPGVLESVSSSSGNRGGQPGPETAHILGSMEKTKKGWFPWGK